LSNPPENEFREVAFVNILSSREIALVTGAARGIGAAIAVERAKNEFDVAVNEHM